MRFKFNSLSIRISRAGSLSSCWTDRFFSRKNSKPPIALTACFWFQSMCACSSFALLLVEPRDEKLFGTWLNWLAINFLFELSRSKSLLREKCLKKKKLRASIQTYTCQFTHRFTRSPKISFILVACTGSSFEVVTICLTVHWFWMALREEKSESPWNSAQLKTASLSLYMATPIVLDWKKTQSQISSGISDKFSSSSSGSIFAAEIKATQHSSTGFPIYPIFLRWLLRARNSAIMHQNPNDVNGSGRLGGSNS